MHMVDHQIHLLSSVMQASKTKLMFRNCVLK